MTQTRILLKTTAIFTAAILSTMLLSTSANAYNVGDNVDASVLKQLNIDPNKVTLVDFFASWCTSCKKELPILDNMNLNKNQVEIIGVDTDKKVAKGKAFQKKLKLKMRIYNDPSQAVISKFKPFGMPALYYIKGGKVVQIRQGAIPNIDKKIEKDLKKLL